MWVESSWHRRIRLAEHLRGFPVETEAAGAEDDDVEEPAGHHQVLVEVDHVALISGRQMHAKSSNKADEGEQSGRPSGVEAHQQGQAAEQVGGTASQTAILGAGT